MVRCPQMDWACFCERFPADSSGLQSPQLLRPVCRLRAALPAPGLPSERLFLNSGGKKVLTELRGFARTEGWGGAARPGAHSFWRVAARAITQAGGPFAKPVRAGQWSPSAHRSYLDLGHDDSRATTTRLAGASEDTTLAGQ